MTENYIENPPWQIEPIARQDMTQLIPTWKRGLRPVRVITSFLLRWFHFVTLLFLSLPCLSCASPILREEIAVKSP